jgi:hypothetical protein
MVYLKANFSRLVAQVLYTIYNKLVYLALHEVLVGELFTHSCIC